MKMHCGTLSVILLLIVMGQRNKVVPLSLEATVHIILGVRKHFTSGCVFLFYDHSDLGDMATLISLEKFVINNWISLASLSIQLSLQQKSASVVECSKNLPLYVLLSSNQNNKEILKKFSRDSLLPRARWLLFLDDKSKISDFFSELYIPLNCIFLVCEQRTEEVLGLMEVYHIHSEITEEHHVLPLQISTMGHWNTNLRKIIWSHRGYYERRRDLKGVIMKVGIKVEGLMLKVKNKIEEKPTEIGGFVGTIWNVIQNELNITSDFYVSKEHGSGSRQRDGSWTGLTGMVMRKEVEMCVGGFIMNTKSVDVVDFTAAMGPTSIATFVRETDIYKVSWDLFLNPFSGGLWFAVVATFIILSIFLWGVYRLGCRYGNEETERNFYFGFGEICLNVFGSICQQGNDTTPRAVSTRMVYLTSYLVSIVLLAGYSATLIAFLTIRSKSLPFTSYADLLASKNYKLGIVARSEEINYFDNMTDPVLQKVYNELIAPNEQYLPNTTLAGLQKVCDRRNYAFVCSAMRALSVSPNLTCRVKSIPGVAVPAFGAMIIRKNSPYRRLINYELLKLKLSSQFDRIFQHTMPTKEKISRADHTKPIRLESTAPVFVILVGGIILSLLFLALENRKRRSENLQQSCKRSKFVPINHDYPLDKHKYSFSEYFCE